MRGSRLPWILLVAVSAFGYGSGPLFAKWIYPTGFDWLDLLAWRHFLAALILGLVVLALPAGRAALRSLSLRRALTALAIGALFVANASTYFASLIWIDASLAGLMTYAYPAIVAVLSIFFAHAPSGARPWVALGIATTGVALGVGGISAGKEPALIGLVLGVASPIIYSGYIILAARLGGESKSGTGSSRGGGIPPLAAVPLSLAGTALGVFALRLFAGRDLLPTPIPDDALLPILGVATIAGIVPIGAFYAGAQRLGAARAALVSTVEPIFTIVAAGLIFGERLTAVQLLGGALILIAVLVAEWGAIRVSITAALVLAISISGVANGAAPSIDANASGKIEGSGATFPWNQYTDWFRSFTDENTEATAVTTGTSQAQFHSSNSTNSLVLGYTGGGSGAGITNFYGTARRSPTQMFSGSDAILTSSQRASIAATDIGNKYSVIPAITGPLSVVYRLDGLRTTAGAAATLRLNGPVICGIYLGTIKKWNDPQIKALNPSVANLPSANINVVGRSDGSGTTFVFASYLGKASSAAQKNCGYHSNFTSSTEANLNDAAGTFTPAQTAPGTYFAAIRAANGAPAITGKPGNGGIAPYIKATNFSISYVESSYASKYGLKEAALAAKTKRNGATVYLKPTVASINSALKNAVNSEDPINPSTSFVQPVFAAGVNSYPIVGYSWWLIYHEYDNANGTTLGQVQGMVAFMNWALTEGQKSTYLYKGYTPVPAVARAKAIAELKKITFNGAPVWP